MTLRVLNPAGLYDSSPNAYSQVAIVPAGSRLAFVSGQGGDNPDGSFSPDFATQAALAGCRRTRAQVWPVGPKDGTAPKARVKLAPLFRQMISGPAYAPRRKSMVHF